MIDLMLLESVNVGAKDTITFGNRSITTGICKRPVAGSVEISEQGVADDHIERSEHHGGVDQAVYAYSADDYEWWISETGKKLSAGSFGENLTIRGLPTDMSIGDRLLIGEVVLEVTGPRIPCDALATVMADTAFGLAFRKAERPGIYLRVLSGGAVSAGDAVTLVNNNASDVTVLDLFRFYYALRHDVDSLHRFLAAPIAARFRTKIENKVAALEADEAVSGQ